MPYLNSEGTLPPFSTQSFSFFPFISTCQHQVAILQNIEHCMNKLCSGVCITQRGLTVSNPSECSSAMFDSRPNNSPLASYHHVCLPRSFFSRHFVRSVDSMTFFFPSTSITACHTAALFSSLLRMWRLAYEHCDVVRIIMCVVRLSFNLIAQFCAVESACHLF